MCTFFSVTSNQIELLNDVSSTGGEVGPEKKDSLPSDDKKILVTTPLSSSLSLDSSIKSGDIPQSTRDEMITPAQESGINDDASSVSE